MKNGTVKKIERFGDKRTTRILFIILAMIVLVLDLGFVESLVYAYSGTSNITDASVDDSRVDPSDSVSWTVGPILNGTENPIQNGWGMDFDGTGDYINCGSDASLDELGPLTYSAWIYPLTLGEADIGKIFSKQYTNFGFYSTGTNPTMLRFLVTYATTNLVASSEKNVVSFNQWSHVAVTWDGSSEADNIHIYVNGVEVSSYVQRIDGVDARTSDAGQNQIIGSNAASTQDFNGTIDEVRIYNRTLGSGEIMYSYQHKVPLNQTGLVLWVDFDQQVQDQSGNGNNGVVNGDPEYVRGIRGKAALTLDGTGDYVGMGDVLNASVGSISFGGWIYVQGSGTAGRYFISKGGYTTTAGYCFFIRGSNKGAVGISDGVDYIDTNSVTSFLDDRWYHVFIVWNSSSKTVTLYVNGNKDHEATNSSIDNIDSVENLYIGIRTGQCFNGSIDEARIYNRTLSATEIAEHYQGIYRNETGLVLHLDFDGNVNDHSGEGNNGVVNGDPEYSDGWANCPVSTSYNGSGGTTVELVNSTTGLATIPDTSPATPGNYTVTASTPAATANATYPAFIVDHYLIDLHTSYPETEAGFRALITGTGESVIDGHRVTYGDALNVDGVGALTWSNYTDCFQDTVTSGTPATVTYDTVTSFLEDTYGITSAEINTTITVTWTTGTLDRLQTKFMEGDWIGAIFDEEAYLVGTLTLYTFILGTISIAVWNVTGPYGTFIAWLLGWIIFAATIHGPAQSMALLLFALGCGIMLAKLYLDRRTT